MADTYGYTLNSGEKYFLGKYLQKSNKKQFQLMNRDVFVTTDEVFEAFIDDKLAIDNNEYLCLIEQLIEHFFKFGSFVVFVVFNGVFMFI